ncbi:MAG: SpoIVB peptidase S55 domain-containing protein [Brevinematales bacterium]
MKKWLAVLSLLWNVMAALDILPLSEIRPGMKGTGYSVFFGWDPVPFEVEVIDVMQGTTPEETRILARLSGQKLEQSGVVAGMSGSPVYIDGKLIGAVAYAWSFSKEAICGITPIQAMIEKTSENLPASPKPSFPGKRRNILFPSSIYLWSESRGAIEMFSNRVPFPMQIFPLQGGGNAKKDAPTQIRPGDAIAIHLVDGDVRIQAIGTVTAVSQDRVWMFGHPLFQAGAWEAPFSRAYIYTVMPAYTVSFKLGTSGEEVGSVVYDGAFAVEGKIGKKANMIEVVTTLIEFPKTNIYRYRVVRSPLYQSYFLLSGLFAILQNSLGGEERHVFDVSARVDVLYKGKTNTVLSQFAFFWERDAETFSRFVGDLWDFFQNVGNWRGETVRMERVEIAINKISPSRVGFVERVWVDRSTYQIGETITVSLQMRDDFSRVYRQTIRVPIPLYLSSGKYSLLIGDAQGVSRYIENESKVFSDILSYEELLRYYKAKERFSPNPSELWCGLLLPSSSFRTERGELPAFPKRYWEWVETGPNVGRESRRFSFLPVRVDIPFLLFYDVTVLSVTIQTNNTRSAP